jgi:hypothetical protein
MRQASPLWDASTPRILANLRLEEYIAKAANFPLKSRFFTFITTAVDIFLLQWRFVSDKPRGLAPWNSELAQSLSICEMSWSRQF